jgi:hypothetical protein
MSARTPRRHLDALMRTHKLSSSDVSKIINRTPAYVRALRNGIYPLRPELVRLVELTIAHRKRRAAATPKKAKKVRA